LETLFDDTAENKNNLNNKTAPNNWVGNLLLNAKLNPNEYDTHRAFISDYCIDNDYIFYAMMDSAWDEKMEAMNAVFNTVDPELKPYYFAEECGMEYFVSNDIDNKYFGDYYVDIVEDNYKLAKETGSLERVRETLGEDTTFFTTRELKAALAELLNDPFTKLDKMIDQINECEVWDPEETGLYLGIHKIEKVEK
jgi:hypothetical protein